MADVELKDRIEAQAEVRRWLLEYGAMHAARNEQIRRADQLGIRHSEIAQLVGLTRKHVSAIVNTQG